MWARTAGRSRGDAAKRQSPRLRRRERWARGEGRRLKRRTQPAARRPGGLKIARLLHWPTAAAASAAARLHRTAKRLRLLWTMLHW